MFVGASYLVNPSLIGLAMALAVGLAGVFQYGVRLSTEVESLVSVYVYVIWCMYMMYVYYVLYNYIYMMNNEYTTFLTCYTSTLKTYV